MKNTYLVINNKLRGVISMKKVIVIVFTIFMFLTACSKAKNPYNPLNEGALKLVQTYAVNGQPVDIDISEECVFVAEDLLGFSIFNRTTGNRYLRVDELPETGQLRKSVITRHNDDYGVLFVFDRTNSSAHNLHSLSFDTPADSLGGYEIEENIPILFTPQFIRDIAFDNNPHEDTFNIYITGFNLDNKLLQGEYNVNSTSGKLMIREMVSLPNAINDMLLTEELIITAMGQRGVYILDKNDMNINLATIDTPGEATSIAVKGDIIFVADGQQGLRLVDISDVTNSFLLEKSISISGNAVSVDISGNYLALGSETGGVYLFDISNPRNPVQKDRKTMNQVGYIFKVQFFNNDLYIASRDKGVMRFSVN